MLYSSLPTFQKSSNQKATRPLTNKRVDYEENPLKNHGDFLG